MINSNHGLSINLPDSNRLRLSLLLILSYITFLFSSCNSKGEEMTSRPPTIQLATSATLGSYLADTSGRTLYSFANDFNGQNNCTGGCLAMWPVYYAGDNLTQNRLPAGLDIADFATVTTATGAKQTTYKSWPLYYFAPPVNGTNTPEPINQTNGEGFAGFWHVAKPDYTIRLVNAQLTGLDGKNYTSAYVEGNGKTLYFSDAKGATIYTFTKDSSNNNNFTLPDFSNNDVWPIYETDKVVVPSTLDKTLFGSITVFGKKQLTYKGWPLYYFGPDGHVRGINKGVSVPTPGIWPVGVKDAPAAPIP